jgi:toxin ParE1/3/4
MLEVVLRPRAAADFFQIAQYTRAEWGEAQAKRYLEDLRRQIDFAAEFPGIGSPAVGLPPQYRKIRSGAHRAIYRCTETELIVLRVVHEREDVPDENEDFW